MLTLGDIMSDEEQPTEEIDFTGTLGSIADSLTGYKENETTGKAGLIAGLVAMVLALIAVAVLAYQAFKAGKERAKALHEQAVREEQAHQAEVDASLAEDQEKVVAALAEAERLQAEVGDLKVRAEELAKEREKAQKQIDKITSWEDVDAIVRR